MNNFQLVLFHKFTELLQGQFAAVFKDVSQLMQATLAQS